MALESSSVTTPPAVAATTTRELITFKVDDIKKSTAPLHRDNWEKLVTHRCNKTHPESCSLLPADRIPLSGGRTNAFVEAINTAYDEHYPLVLSPDAVWMLIAQGFSRHVNVNAEKLRNLLVEHEGKKTLTVTRDDFDKGDPDNPWPEVFGEMSEHIRKNIGSKLHDLLTPTFSTTGPVERAAAQVVLMDTLKEYFEYLVMSRCGIPEITLEGTVEDWIQLRDKAVSLGEFEVEWWIKELKPVLDQFVDAASGKSDQKFWSKMYKHEEGSGGPFVQGWIITFFPYLGSMEPYIQNIDLVSWKDKDFFGIPTSEFHYGVCATPFVWNVYDIDFPMHFFAGFMGVSQHSSSLAIRPEIGWAICDDGDMKRAEKRKYN